MTQPTSWQQLWDQAQSTLSNAERSLASTSSPVTSRVLRVGQLDAELLDIELVNILRDPLSKALGLVSVRPPRLTVPSWLCQPEASDECGFRVQSTLKSRFEPELSLFIQLTLYRLSVWATGASYGAKLQDLKYTYNASSASNARVHCTCNYFCHGALYCLEIYCVPPHPRSAYHFASENSSRTRGLDDGPALYAHPLTQARPIQSLAGRPELGSPKKGLGADDQIGDHPRGDRPRKLCGVPLGRTVSRALFAPL